MRTVIKLGAIAAGAYILFGQQILSALGLSDAGAPATRPAQQPAPGAAQPAPAPSVDTATLRAALLAATAADGFFIAGRGDYDHWSFYFNRLSGATAPDPNAIGVSDRTALVDVDTYLAAVIHGVRY